MRCCLKDIEEAELDILTIEGVLEDLESQKQVSPHTIDRFLLFCFRRLINEDCSGWNFPDGTRLDNSEINASILFDKQILAFLIPTILGFIITLCTASTGISFSPLFGGAALGAVLSFLVWSKREENRKRFNDTLDGMIKEYERMERDALAYREQLYALDIIYKDYRSIVPVTMFIKYLESGRCSLLQGPHGGYSLYEEDVFRGRVTGDLGSLLDMASNISQQLSGIAENNKTLLDSVQKCYDKMDVLSDAALKSAQTNEKLLEQAEFIRYNTELARKHAENMEQYAQKIESNTSAAAGYASAAADSASSAAYYTRQSYIEQP